MNVLDRIVELRTAKGWSEYQLAEESGMTQSTISSWYRRHMTPSVPSLERICDAFDISLSQFFMESGSQPIVLTDKQVELINATNKLSPEQLDNLLIFLNSLNAKSSKFHHSGTYCFPFPVYFSNFSMMHVCCLESFA